MKQVKMKENFCMIHVGGNLMQPYLCKVEQQITFSKTLIRLSALSFLFLFCFNSFGQKNQYQNLLNTAFAGHSSLFVYSKPTNVQLDANELWFYLQNWKDYSHQILDTIMFLQIIQNVRTVDTAMWQDSEVPLALLVTDKNESISRQYAIQKLSLIAKKQIRFYSKQVNQFNSTEAVNKNITSFSRPVFDNTKQFAVVQWENGHDGLGGGGNIILYQLRGDTWKELGIIKNWRH